MEPTDPVLDRSDTLEFEYDEEILCDLPDSVDSSACSEVEGENVCEKLIQCEPVMEKAEDLTASGMETDSDSLCVTEAGMAGEMDTIPYPVAASSPVRKDSHWGEHVTMATGRAAIYPHSTECSMFNQHADSPQEPGSLEISHRSTEDEKPPDLSNVLYHSVVSWFFGSSTDQDRDGIGHIEQV
jgi:hypothetical protein